MASRFKGKARQQPGFVKDLETKSQEGKVPDALLRQARQSGQLNLSNRGLIEVPEEVWRINMDTPEPGKDVSLDTQSGNRWWEQTDLKKLILASNQLQTISSDIQSLHALSVLDVHDNKLESLPDEIGLLVDLWKLNLSHNKLSSLPKSLKCLTSLKVVILSGNSLKQLPEDFGHIMSLEELDLSDNKISCLPQSIGNLSKVKKLNLSKNLLEELPESIGKMTGLRDLSLCNNKLTILPCGLEDMKSIDILDCRNNLINKFPLIKGQVSLKELYLGNNRINCIDPEIFQFLPLLVTLDVKDNTVQSIPEEIRLLKNLERLELSNNGISSLPFIMGQMESITSITLDGNPLRGIRRDVAVKGTQALLKYLKSRIVAVEPHKEIESGFGQDIIKSVELSDGITSGEVGRNTQNPSQNSKTISYCNKKAASIPESCFSTSAAVSTIDLSNNCLTQIPATIVSYCSSLTELNLRSNKLTDIPREFSVLLKLKYLDVGNNMISCIHSECKSWKSLNQIIISGNRFQTIPEFLFDIKDLEIILASSNQITDIDVKSLLKLPRLGSLDLSNNNITTVPPELGNVASLKSLQLEGNPFRNPRHTILLKGTSYLLDYLRDRIPR